MFTLKARQGDESYNIRVKVDNGKLKIVYAKQRTRAEVHFDILCLHRSAHIM